MRLVLVTLSLALGLALTVTAQSALRDGDLVVPIPPQWIIWRPAEIAAANPNVPVGHTVVGMAAEHPLGHPAPQATVTLERLDLRQLGLTAMDSVQLAETHFVQMRRDAPGFETEGDVFPTRLGEIPAHGWQGVLPLTLGQTTLRVRVWQTVAVRGHVAHVLTFYLPEEETVGTTPSPATPERAVVANIPEGAVAEVWVLGSFTLDVPAGWRVWPPSTVEEMRASARQRDASVVDVNGIVLPAAESGGFQPSVAAAAMSLAAPISHERLSELARQSAEHTVAGTLSAEITLAATPFQMAGRSAAIAVVEGAMMDRGSLRPVRIDQLWLDGGDTALRFVVITDLDDEATRQTIGAMLAALRD